MSLVQEFSHMPKSLWLKLNDSQEAYKIAKVTIKKKKKSTKEIKRDERKD